LVEIERGGHTLVGYPALVDAADGVSLQVFDSPEKARSCISRRAACGRHRLLRPSATSSVPSPGM
jgi:hypothetical protein